MMMSFAGAAMSQKNKKKNNKHKNVSVSLVLQLMMLGFFSVAATAAQEEEQDCVLYCGWVHPPSPIKEAEDHGWGLNIPCSWSLVSSSQKEPLSWEAVQVLGKSDESNKKVVLGDLFIPVYDWEALDIYGSLYV